MSTQLEFEKPLLELESKITELKTFSTDNNVDLKTEIEILENKLESMRTDLYADLTPWQKVRWHG